MAGCAPSCLARLVARDEHRNNNFRSQDPQARPYCYSKTPSDPGNCCHAEDLLEVVEASPSSAS